jgi:DNA-binding transcriptional LysR family regulator
MHFDLVDMRLFLHVAQSGSITKGAEQAHLALASASVRIRELETALGVPLFTRGRRGVELTAAGSTFLHHARTVLQQLEQMQAEMDEYTHGIKARVRLLCNTSAFAEHLPAVLNSYMVDHPNIAIDLEERPSYDIVRTIVQGAADVGIVADMVELRGLQTFPFRPDPLVLVVPQRHALLSKKKRTKPSTISFSDVLGEEFVGLAGDSALRHYLEEQAARFGKRIRYRVLMRSFETICQMVETGVGVAVVPQSAATRCAKSMALVQLRLAEPWAKRQLLLCMRDFDALSHYVKQLVQQLRA